MPQKEIVRRMKVKDREAIVLWLAFAGFCVGLSLYAGNKFWAFSFSLLFLYCAFKLIRSFYDKIKITDDKVVVTRYFKPREICWGDISRLESKLTGFLLINHSEDNRIFISAEIMNLWEFLKIVKKQRRDLLQPTKNVFHENPTIAIAISCAGLFLAYFSVARMITDQANYTQKIIVLAIGIGFTLIVPFSWKRFHFDQDKLIVKTMVRTRAIQLEGIDFGSIGNTDLFIISKDRYSVSINNLVEGMPVFLISFQSWLHTKSGKFNETVDEDEVSSERIVLK